MPSSPVPKSSDPHAQLPGIAFPEAIAAVIDGQRISKREWDNTDSYGMLRDGRLMIHKDNTWFNWIVNDGDLIGKDWFVLSPKGNHER